MSSTERSESLWLRTHVRCTHKQTPPWHDEWGILMDGWSLIALSEELMALPEPLPPRLRQLRRMTEEVISHGLDEHWAAQGDPHARFP